MLGECDRAIDLLKTCLRQFGSDMKLWFKNDSSLDRIRDHPRYQKLRMSDVCREFGISRKTGYKIYNRYKEDGLEALTDRSRRPVRYANQLPGQIERLIVEAKRDKPHWGAPKACARA